MERRGYGQDPRFGGPPMMMPAGPMHPAHAPPPLRSRSRGRYREPDLVYSGYEPNPRKSYRPIQTIQPDPIPVFVGPPIGPGGYRYPPHANPSLRRVASGKNGAKKEQRVRSKSGRRHRDNSGDRDLQTDPLQDWSKWRTSINDGLSSDLRSKRYREIPVGEEFDKLVKPPSKTKHGVYHYSTAIDQGTQLHKEDFVNFGIPRASAKMNGNHTYSGSSSDGSSSDSNEGDKPFYTINKIGGESNGASNGFRGDVRNSRHRSRERRQQDGEYGGRHKHRGYR